jgi:hypothetical protein
MSALFNEEELNRIIDQRAEAKVIEMMQAIGLRAVGSTEDDEPLMTPCDFARQLGEDVSTQAARRKAEQHVYYLVRTGYLPGVWLGKRKLRIKPAEARKFIDNGGAKKATGTHG